MQNFIAGRNPVMEALKAGTQIEKIVILIGVKGKVIEDIKTMAQRKGVAWEESNKLAFRELVRHATTQGVVAIVPTKQFVGLEEVLAIGSGRNETGFVLILDEIEDPHNLGALIRTAECAGVHGVIIPKHHAASVTSTVVKTSAGATEHMPIAEVTNIVTTVERLKEAKYWIVGLDAAGGKLYTEIDYRTPIAIIVGNEGRGLRRLVKEHCDFLVKIPLYGKLDSLNASVAGALVMYEAAKQRRIVAALA
jgi:23S rRNA (guanosine2251-2'-O)-methyltransferase